MVKTQELGCIASIFDGLIYPFTECPNLQIHHISGQKKKNAHFLVLPLLEQNHNYMFPGSLHHNKKQFTMAYGSERELWHRVQAHIYPEGFPEDIKSLLDIERWTTGWFDNYLYEEFLCQ